MNCVECRDRLVDYVEGLLDLRSAEMIEAHVGSCPPCRSELAALRNLQSRLQRDGQAPPDVALGPLVMDRILQTQAIKIRRFRMLKRLCAIGAAAAALIVGAVLTVGLLEKSTTPAYALAQTVEANRSLTTVHLKCDPPGKGAGEVWVQFDDAGELQWARVDFPASEDGCKIVIWQADKAQVWFKDKNSLLTLRDAESRTKAREELVVDPKQVVERLYQAQTQGRVVIETQQPAAKGEPITLTVTAADSTEFRDVYVVDPETKLLRRLDKYRLDGGQYKLLGSIIVVDYNQPIAPSVAKLDLPPDISRIDWTTQEVGLAKGSLSEEELAAQLAREFFEALIVQDYAKAGRLYSGMPAEKMQQVFGNFKFQRIVSVGQPAADPQLPGRLHVPCAVEVTRPDGVTEAGIFDVKVRPVPGQRDRWSIDGGI